MIEFVVDSSVVLAILLKERLDGDVLELIEGSTMSSVNYAEVWTKLHQLGIDRSRRIDNVFSLLEGIAYFTDSQARVAGSLHTMTKHAGLSLGDRACLALALEMDAEALTTDRAWKTVNVGCPIRVIR